MDELYERFHHGRRDMRAAFVRVSDLARRAGVDWDAISEAHGQFFDGNAKIRDAFSALVLLAEIWRPPRSRT